MSETKLTKTEELKESLPKRIARSLGNHFSYWREIYLWPLIAIAFVLIPIFLFVNLTGKMVVDGPGILVSTGYAFAQLIIAATFTALVDNHLFNDLRKEDWKAATIWEKVLDISKTLIVFVLAVWFIKS